uniref:RING-type domain-containing protein n=1 Tax=Gopherus agassizii TaxID=38772 RepID=A0A452GFM4_9SAUR
IPIPNEATCSICLDYFEDPVSIRCGHNFCRACISQYWRKSDTNFSCPQCRKIVQHRNFKPNRVLANVRQLEFLKQERDEVLGFKRSGEMKTQKLLVSALVTH